MKQTIGFYEFRNAFESLRPDNFSYEGLSLLWDYFEQYEEDTGEEIELDVIAICCEYSEDDIGDFIKAYDVEVDEDMSEDEVKAAIAAAVAETGAASIKDMGKVMGVLKGKYTGQMDFGQIGPIVKGLLGG